MPRKVLKKKEDSEEPPETTPKKRAPRKKAPETPAADRAPPVVTFSPVPNIQINMTEIPPSGPPPRPNLPPPSEPEITESIVVLSDDKTHSIATFSPLPIFTSTNPFEEDPSKKKGRKPKGGKIVMKNKEYEKSLAQVSNVILHLKCSMSDLRDYNMKISKMVTNELTYDPNVPPEIQTYNSDLNADKFSNYGETIHSSGDSLTGNANNTMSFNNDAAAHGNMKYAYLDPNNTMNNKTPAQSLQSNLCRACNASMAEEANPAEENDVNMKDINHKLKHLKINLYKNTLQDKKSACFWCTYDYDNQPCYIPKYEMDEKVYGYGSFCRPECAVAYLMKENLDDSTKFERYHLLNNLYGKVYDFKKNIKPAPNPYYLLEKFFGNLTIQEYRKLLKTEHLLTVIEKPLSRTLPELFEDNDNFLLGIYGGSTKSGGNGGNVFKVKRQSDKTPVQSKTAIMKEKFGLV
jgi:hypothetical protein